MKKYINPTAEIVRMDTIVMQDTSVISTSTDITSGEVVEGDAKVFNYFEFED